MNVLFVGQCKQGSNSLFEVLRNVPGLTEGKDIRGMVRTHNAKTDYLTNWAGKDLSNTKYLIDKSIVNPKKYNYKVLDWQNYQHKMIYMIRNIHDVLKSQFMVVLAGEESYQFEIPRGDTCWTAQEFTKDIAKLVIDYNSQKYSHYDNIMSLDKDVFDVNTNMFFTTFENFLEDTKGQFDKLSEFVGVPIHQDFYPKVNMLEDIYKGNKEEMLKNAALFDEYKEYIFNYCIDYYEWEKLSELFKEDLIQKYGIKKEY